MAYTRPLALLLLWSSVVPVAISAATPSCTDKPAVLRTVGYYDTSVAGTSCGIFPESIKVSGYTHINAAHAYINPTTFEVAFAKTKDPDIWRRLVALRDVNPGLKVWLSIGGWTMNNPGQPTQFTFNRLAGSGQQVQENFFNSLLAILGSYGFDGVDIDWQYPGVRTQGGGELDFLNYPAFLKNLRGYLDSSGFAYGVSITYPGLQKYQSAFDVLAIEPWIDWFNVINYNLHCQNDTISSSTTAAHANIKDFDNAFAALWAQGIVPAKVTLGLGFYGRSYTLPSTQCRDIACPASGFTNTGPCAANETGMLSYDQIMDIVDSGAVPYTSSGVKMLVYDTVQWVTYDDATTLGQKVQYANQHCLGGQCLLQILCIITDRQQGPTSGL
ncbi:hypothetical protein LTR95_005700 [Oleoguttula sp. CCFEE 5521]